MSTRLRQRIPGPPGLPFIGSTLAYDTDPLGWLTSTRAKYGDVVRLDPATVVVHDPVLIHEVLRSTNDEFLLDNALDGGRRGREALLAGLPEWMRTRRYLGRAANSSVLASHLPRVRRHLADAVTARAGRWPDLFEQTQRMLGTATADYCVGAAEDVEAIARAVEELFWASLAVTDSGESRLGFGRRPVATAATRLNDDLVAMLAELVAERRAASRPDAARDVLDALLAHPDGLTDRQIVGAIRLLMVTSHGPPGAAFAWTLLHLAGRPELIDAIRAEAADEGRLFGPRSVTLAVVKEALRLHPPVWLIGRTTLRPTNVGGYALRANRRVLASPYLVHRDPRHHADPDEFRPQRWHTGDAPRPHTYLPFGSGPRVCPGARLGELQVLIAVAMIVRDHRLDLPPVAEVTARTSTLLIPDAVAGGWLPR